MKTICNRCPLMCGLIDLPTAALPMDNPTPLRGVTPEGAELADIREYCKDNNKIE